jgi:hypothetical protein
MLVRSPGVAVIGETSAGRNDIRLSLREGSGGGVEGGTEIMAGPVAVGGGGPAGGGGITESGEGIVAGTAVAGLGVAGAGGGPGEGVRTRRGRGQSLRVGWRRSEDSASACSGPCSLFSG